MACFTLARSRTCPAPPPTNNRHGRMLGLNPANMWSGGPETQEVAGRSRKLDEKQDGGDAKPVSISSGAGKGALYR